MGTSVLCFSGGASHDICVRLHGISCGRIVSLLWNYQVGGSTVLESTLNLNYDCNHN